MYSKINCLGGRPHLALQKKVEIVVRYYFFIHKIEKFWHLWHQKTKNKKTFSPLNTTP